MISYSSLFATSDISGDIINASTINTANLNVSSLNPNKVVFSDASSNVITLNVPNTYLTNLTADPQLQINNIVNGVTTLANVTDSSL